MDSTAPTSERASPILPPGADALHSLSARSQAQHGMRGLIEQFRMLMATGQVSEAQLTPLINSIPRETMRKLVYSYAGMDASLFLTLKQQVTLVDRILANLVTPDGQLRPIPEDMPSISLKDAVMMSTRVTQMILRDLPRVYNLEKVAKMEIALGNVMERHLSPSQQAEVLAELERAMADS